jgi:hypothetical protein
MTIPSRPDGTRYRYEMICDNRWSRLYDDSVEGLLSYLIPGYRHLDENQRLGARIRHAVDSQVVLQAQLNVFFRGATRSSEEEALLLGPRHIQLEVDTWECEVPLVLVDAYYAPYTDIQKPRSAILDVAIPPNIWWLNPAQGEMDYLLSLHEASVIDLNIAKDEAI